MENLEAIIATHPHADHIGGLAAVIENFPVEVIYDSGKVHTSQTYENYLLLIDEKEIQFETPRRGDNIELNNLTFNIIHPGKEVEEYGLNQVSITAYLKYDQVSFLFTGDIEETEESELRETEFNINSTILKVAHHGSKTSSSELFLEAVSPEVAIITVGENNRFGHPAPEVINRFQDKNIEVYRTDLNGDIVIKTDGKDYSIESVRSFQEDGEELSKLKQSEGNRTETNLLNINQASKSKLETLWGVGPVTAENILKYREKNDGFQSIEEIKDVDGIDSNKFNRWSDWITI